MGQSDSISDGEIIGVNWSPPFEGPLSIPSSYLEPYYKAYGAFQRILDDTVPANSTENSDNDLIAKYQNFAKQYTWQKKMQPGQVLVFNNRRMLHGRRSFNLKKCKRLLAGCYTNIDDTLNVFRVL